MDSLATVNFFLCCVGTVQLARIMMYRSSLKDGNKVEAAKSIAEEQKEAVKEGVEKVKEVVS
jgi:mitochondrial pyruvate carrier 2